MNKAVAHLPPTERSAALAEGQHTPIQDILEFAIIDSEAYAGAAYSP